MDCIFCGKKVIKGTEYIYVTSKGRLHNYCSSKCLKNQEKLNRKPRRTKWTGTYRQEKQARLKALKAKEEKAKEKKPIKADKEPEATKAKKPETGKGPAKEDKKTGKKAKTIKKTKKKAKTKSVKAKKTSTKK
jgi:ribosomal protein L24E